jgi:hypothetical protein
MLATAMLSCEASKPATAGVSDEVRVGQEIDRLDAALRKLEATRIPGGLVDLRRGARATLTRADKSRSALLRLYRMRDAVVGIGTLGFLVEHQAAGGDLAGVTALWNQRRALFPLPTPPSRGSALDRALAETAGNRAAKLFVASLPYAKASSPGDGLYYLAEAEGNRQYRLFVESLAGENASSEPAPRREALEAAMRLLDAETVAAFDRDPAGFSAVNPSAHLNESHELADQNLLDGAALTLLETRLILGRSNPASRPASPPSRLDSIAGSIRALFEAVAAESPEKAAAIRSDVLPLYASLFVATSANHRPRPEVTVTLVRWPFT